MKQNELIVNTLHTKIYNFNKSCYTLLKKYPASDKFTLEDKIRNLLYEILDEIIRYENSHYISHMYTINTDINVLKELFKLSRDVNISIIDDKKVVQLTNELDDMNSLVNTIISSSMKSSENNNNRKMMNRRNMNNR